MAFSGYSLLTWLVIAWAFFTTLLILLAIYRGLVGMHQEDQVFLTEAARGFAAESAAAGVRLAKLRPYVVATSSASVALAVAIAAIWVTQLIRQF